jgi:hypothetical protein
MASELYDVIAEGIRHGITWEVGASKRGSLILTVGVATIALAGDERDRFAEAVARAVTPGQVTP